MKQFLFAIGAAFAAMAAFGETVVVEASHLSKYRPETVEGGAFLPMAQEKLPCVVDVLTGDFIEESSPTDLHDLLRFVPGIESGGKSLLIRQPGAFSLRGMGGTEPMLDGVIAIGRGSGLFLDPFFMERIEIVKGPVGALGGGAGAVQNASGAGGSVNLYMKSANLESDGIHFSEKTSAGKNLLRQRVMFDANSLSEEGDAAFRIISSFDYYEPTYINSGSQKGADGRKAFAAAPSMIWQVNDSLRAGFKSLVQYIDQPSHIGVPVFKGCPAGGYGWEESSCLPDNRSTYKSLMASPWVDYEAADGLLLKAGAGFMISEWRQNTREPYAGSGDEIAWFCNTGMWPQGQKYMRSSFSESSSLSKNLGLYFRAIWNRQFSDDIGGVLLAQPDFYYRESSGGFGIPVSRYGATLQETVTMGDLVLLAGCRVDYFAASSCNASITGASGKKETVRHGRESEKAFSPRVGLSYRFAPGLVFFGNVSQTKTPMLGNLNADGTSPTRPWTATQCEAGLRCSLAESLWASLSFYRIEQENLPVEDVKTGFYAYEGANRSEGTEFSLSGDILDNWTVMAMYAYGQYENLRLPKGARGRKFERHPKHSFSVNTSYRADGGVLDGVVFGASARFRSMSYACMRGEFVHENLRFDPSLVVDVNMALPLGDVFSMEEASLHIGVRNLFDEKYFESARHYYEALAGEPRTFEVGIKASF